MKQSFFAFSHWLLLAMMLYHGSVPTTASSSYKRGLLVFCLAGLLCDGVKDPQEDIAIHSSEDKAQFTALEDSIFEFVREKHELIYEEGVALDIKGQDTLYTLPAFQSPKHTRRILQAVTSTLAPNVTFSTTAAQTTSTPEEDKEDPCQQEINEGFLAGVIAGAWMISFCACCCITGWVGFLRGFSVGIFCPCCKVQEPFL